MTASWLLLVGSQHGRSRHAPYRKDSKAYLGAVAASMRNDGGEEIRGGAISAFWTGLRCGGQVGDVRTIRDLATRLVVWRRGDGPSSEEGLVFGGETICLDLS